MTGQKDFHSVPHAVRMEKIVQCFLCLILCETDSLQGEPWDDIAKRIFTLFLRQSEGEDCSVLFMSCSVQNRFIAGKTMR
jgi:hypothetical protein